MENNLKVFNNAEFGTVRVIEVDDETWFVGKDVAESLGYSNTNKAIQMHVYEEDKKVLDYKGYSQIGKSLWNDSDFANKTIINESGLYSLILSSKLPTAKRFKHWVTSEVLPSIRKHGMYAKDEILDNPDLLIEVATKLKEEREKRIILENKVEQDKPKVLFADAVTASDNSILIRELAKILRQNGAEFGEKRLYRQLREDGFICLNSTEPTQRAMEQGLFERIIRTIQRADGNPLETVTTRVTAKGQMYFVNRYLSQGKKLAKG